MRDSQVMSALDFIKNDDTSDVVAATKASTRRSTRHMLKGAGQPSGFESVGLCDNVDISEDVEVSVEGKKGELPLVMGKESKAVGKKVAWLKPLAKAIEGSAKINPGEIYVPGWKVTIADSFKSSSVCEDVLTHFAPPVVRDSCSSMDDDQMISMMILRACNLVALLPEGISCFRKRMQPRGNTGANPLHHTINSKGSGVFTDKKRRERWLMVNSIFLR
ncbi:hypothetical protein Hanom_Chr11g01029761 [Helianthus anomalus]